MKYQHHRANGYTRVYDRAYAHAYIYTSAEAYAYAYDEVWQRVSYKWENPK